MPAFLPSPTLPSGRRSARSRHAPISQTPRLTGKKILVTGATGPTGRLVCGALHARGATVRALVRPRTYLRARERVHAIRELCPSVELALGDLRDACSLEAAVHGVHGVVSTAGTRNFEGADPNRPELVDLHGVRLLADAFLEAQLELDLLTLLTAGDEGESESSSWEGAALGRGEGGAAVVSKALCNTSRFVLVSTLGVTRPERFPQLQQMGSMMTYKLYGEDALRNSGCPFTIVRPGGLMDTPAGETKLVIDQGDRVAGSISRADVAEICAEAIFCPNATNVTFECVAQKSFDGEILSPESFSADMFRGLAAEDM